MRFAETTLLYLSLSNIRKVNCESDTRQQENQIILQDEEIDHRQLTGIHSNTLHVNVKRAQRFWGKRLLLIHL